MKGRRQAKAWLAKAHESIEGAREHMGLQLRRASKLNVAGSVSTTGRPQRVGHVKSRPELPSSGPTAPGKMDPSACENFAMCPLEQQTGRPGAWCQWGHRWAVPSSPQAPQTARAIWTLPNPATQILLTPNGGFRFIRDRDRGLRPVRHRDEGAGPTHV